MPTYKKKTIMDYLTYSEKLNCLLEMIQKERLLSLKQVSEKFECSKRTIKRRLKALRDQGYPINYSKKTGKYFMEN